MLVKLSDALKDSIEIERPCNLTNLQGLVHGFGVWIYTGSKLVPFKAACRR